MNANTNLKMTFNNNYHIELIDASTGSPKQSGDFHNMLVKNARTLFVATPANTAETRTWAHLVNMLGYLNVGKGTTEPAFTDTALAGHLWSVKAESTSFEWVDDYTGRATAVYTFPATSSYVGTVTEVGLSSINYGSSTSGEKYQLVTRALLTDSEGQPISFEKTDLDILKVTVTVELSLSSLSEDFTLFKKCYFIHQVLLGLEHGANLTASYTFGNIHLCRFYNDLDIYQPVKYDEYNRARVYVRYMETSLDTTPVAMNSDDELYIRYPVVRLLATSITSERYFKAIAFPSLGYWKLPNENILPTYSITGLSVGVGDGSTTSFENPLCYFKKDTDKVYKNGILLTRGVDYTINHVGNKDCLPEVSELTQPIKVYSSVTNPSTLGFIPLIMPTGLNRDLLQSIETEYATAFSTSAPLYIEYEDAVTLNCLKCNGGYWKYIQGTNGYGALPSGSTFYIDASTDGVTYEELGSVSTTGTDASSAFTLDFKETTAKYWRIRLTSSTSYPVGMYDSYNTNNLYFTLNRKDPYITFAEAPAAGDVLTMDVDMDLIMKNSNYVVDVGCRFDFNL